jgi:N-terminal domain of anti-restriction factor ArdC
MKTDIYQRITNQIIAELEKGVMPWACSQTQRQATRPIPPLSQREAETMTHENIERHRVDPSCLAYGEWCHQLNKTISARIREAYECSSMS